MKYVSRFDEGNRVNSSLILQFSNQPVVVSSSAVPDSTYVVGWNYRCAKIYSETKYIPDLPIVLLVVKEDFDQLDVVRWTELRLVSFSLL